MFFDLGRKIFALLKNKLTAWGEVLALAAGFQDGDIIYSIDGSKVERFASENGSLNSEMIQKLILDDAKIITVSRNGKQLNVPFNRNKLKMLFGKNTTCFLDDTVCYWRFY